MRIAESQLRRIIHQEMRRLVEEAGYYRLTANDVFVGKTKSLLDQLVMELTTINKQIVRGLDAMDVHSALDDSGPSFGMSSEPLHAAMLTINRNDVLGDFFYNGDYRRRPSPRQLESALMSHLLDRHITSQVKLDPGETAPSKFSMKMRSDEMIEVLAAAIHAVKTLKKAALKAATMGPSARGMLTVAQPESDPVSYSGPDIVIYSARGEQTEAGFGDGTVEGWEAELRRLAKWCVTKRSVEFQAANDLSATAYDEEGNELGNEYITWSTDGREMASQFNRMAAFFKSNMGAASIQVNAD